MKLAVVLSCLLIHVSLCEGVRRRSVLGESCTTPLKDPGDCRNIENCQELLKVRKDLDGERSADVSALLRDSRCGSTGVDPPLYCCPNLSTKTTTPLPRSQPRSSSLRCGEGPPTINRIIGGRVAELGQWPWMAALGRRGRLSNVHWFCGGALVTDRHVITAAHCLNKTVNVVRLGELNLEDGVKDGASPVDKKVESSVRHPEYEAGRFVNDIAVIKMMDRVIFNGLIEPICLPNAAIPTSYVVGETLDVAGWGMTTTAGPYSSALQQVSVPVVSESTCREAYRDNEEAVIDEKVICAGNGEKDTCQGDSGGPLMDNKNGLFYLVGVVSFGKTCEDKYSPGVYTKVSYYMDWINANIN